MTMWWFLVMVSRLVVGKMQPTAVSCVKVWCVADPSDLLQLILSFLSFFVTDSYFQSRTTCASSWKAMEIYGKWGIRHFRMLQHRQYIVGCGLFVGLFDNKSQNITRFHLQMVTAAVAIRQKGCLYVYIKPNAIYFIEQIFKKVIIINTWGAFMIFKLTGWCHDKFCKNKMYFLSLDEQTECYSHTIQHGHRNTANIWQFLTVFHIILQ